MSLEALERSDFSRLPGGIFTKAFIRAYAQEVGLDPDRTIQEFIAELPPEAAAPMARPLAIEDGEKLDSDRKAVATALRLALVSIPIIGLVIYYGSHRTPAEKSDSPAPAADTPAAQQPPAGPGATAPMATSGVAAVRPASGLSMEISPRARCWVSVNTDGRQVFAGIMNAGDKRVVNATEYIALRIGDAGAFGYTLNGHAGKALGTSGQLVNRRITLSNLQDFVTTAP